jgi:alcohol dehydrogenase (cytochrome c)
MQRGDWGRARAARALRAARVTSLATPLAVVLSVFAGPAVAQRQPAAPAKPTATFAPAQAQQGKAAYSNGCASCHGVNLGGGEFAGPLSGNTFSQNWGGKSAAELFTFIQTRMPPAKPGSLTPQVTAQLVAYLVQINGGRPGGTELAAIAGSLGGLTLPRSPMAPTAPMMPLSPLVTAARPPVVANPLDHITPVTDELLQNPPDREWLTWRRTYDAHGFSPLNQITKANVGGLRVAWTWSFPNGPNETTPLVHDGVIFTASSGDTVQALDAATGDLLWQYSRLLPVDVRPGLHRNIAIYHDRLVLPTSDDHVIALDIRTGALVWDTAIADYKGGYQLSGGPLVAQGKVMQGIAGQSPGGDAIVGLDFETGKEAWRFKTIAHPGEPGGDSWNGLPLEKRSGASVWIAGSYDPKLKLAYFGVGQTYDTGGLLHPVNQPGITNDGLYTDSTLALNPDTGKLAWHFQHLHNDQWDLDWAFERQILDLPVNGSPRKLVVTSGKMAIFEGLDAATGQYVFSKDLGVQNVIASIDPKTGDKKISPAAVLGDGKPHTICPHPGAGRPWLATSYNAATKTVYVPMNDACMDLIPAAPGQRGNLTSGYNWSIRPTADSDGKFGRLEAVNLETRQVVWTQRQRAPTETCTLDTAGGVLFAGSLDRVFKAYDDSNGKALWQARLNDVPNSCPISFTANGKQYVAIVVGSGGPETLTYSVLVPEIRNPPQHGAAIWVFELPAKN